MILKEYNLSVRLPQEKAIDTGITLVQNDKDVYKLNIRIFDGVNEIDYSEVDSATITFLKRDNNVVQGNMAVEEDQLSYTLGTNEIACPGKVLVGIQLFGSTERLSTARFVMSVERDLVTAEAVQSTSEFSILQQLKQDLEAIDVVELTNEFNVHKAESATKHITASGSNDNGYYIKFDDGTQICMHTMVGSDFGLPTSTTTSTTVQGVSFYRSTVKAWDFPAPFVDTNYVLQVYPKNNTGGIRLNWVNPTGNKNTNRAGALQIISLYNDFRGFESVDLVAIGRWK